MGKYESIKILKETKAKKHRSCDRCGQSIKVGDIYYKESIGKVKAIGIALNGFCRRCHQEYGNNLLKQ